MTVRSRVGDRKLHVIAEVLRGCYDFEGRRIAQPSKKRHPSFQGRPMGLFLSQPLKNPCRSVDEIRAFLKTCQYVSDREQFGVRDHWMPPAEFEQTRRGDCDDFALWACRQLLGLGYDARFVVGSSGRYGAGHAWVTFRDQDRTYILEPLLPRRKTFPRLITVRYKPAVSVELSGSQVKFYEHEKIRSEPPLRVIAPLIPEWLFWWVRYWLRTVARLLLWPYRAGRYRWARKQSRHALSSGPAIGRRSY
jgi:predicted transglutaminase-like cysteine proteinase